MNKAILRKAAAFACSLATLSVLGISTFAQTPVPADKDIDSMTDLIDGKINIVAGVIEAQPGETVTFPVYIANNAESGFSAAGIRLIYDSNLTPCTGVDGKLILNKKCTAGDDIVKNFSLNYEKHIIGLGTMGYEPEKDNGLLYTVDIKVPSDAKPGDTFPMSLEVNKLMDAKTNPLDCVALDGCIYIAGQTEQKEEIKEPAGPKGHKEPKGPKDKKHKKAAEPKQEESSSGWFRGSGEIHFYWYADGTWKMTASGKRP